MSFAGTYIYWFTLQASNRAVSSPKILIATREEWFYNRQIVNDSAICLCDNPEKMILVMVDRVFSLFGGYVKSPTVVSKRSIEASFEPSDGGTRVRGVVLAQDEMQGRFDLWSAIYGPHQGEKKAYIGSFQSKKAAAGFMEYRVRALNLQETNWWKRDRGWFLID